MAPLIRLGFAIPTRAIIYGLRLINFNPLEIEVCHLANFHGPRKVKNA